MRTQSILMVRIPVLLMILTIGAVPCPAKEYALSFDGSGDYADTGKMAGALGVGGNASRTISAWVYTRAFNGGAPYDLGQLNSCNTNFSNRTMGSNVWRIEYYCTYSDLTIDSLNKWVHFVQIYDNGNTKFYANGQQILNWNHSTLNTTDVLPLSFGRWGDAPFFNGNVEDVRLYNRAITEAEAQSLFCGVDVTTGLIGHWPFQDGTGTTATDTIGGNPATLVGDTAWVESDLGVSEMMTSIQPDLMLRTDNEMTFTGDDVFNNLAAQSKSQLTGPGLTMVYDVRLENQRTALDQIVITAAGSSDSNWDVKLIDPATLTDLTSLLTTGWTATLNAKSVLDLQVQITPKPALTTNGASKSVTIAVASVSDPSKVDAVKATAMFQKTITASLKRTYTTNADFDQGQLAGLEHDTVANQLQPSTLSTTLPFIWVPNSNQGTVSKVDTVTGRELARYRTCPSNLTGQPSRTTVDLYGNCWVANRQIGTVVKIGLLENGQYMDRNNNGKADTSQDLNGDGNITGSELLPWGMDECVIWEVIVIPGREGTYYPAQFTHVGPNPNDQYYNDYWNPGPRSVAVDKDNNLWVGTFNSRMFYYVEGATGQILKKFDMSSLNHTAYGAVIDSNGIVWSSGGDKRHIVRIDPKTETFTRIDIPHYTYGLGLDKLGHLFVSGWQDSRLTRININTAAIEWTKQGIYETRGVASTDDGDIWVANSGPGTVVRFSNDGEVKATIPVGSQPTGVSIDRTGKVWAVNNGDEYIHRIDPATNTVDLTKQLIGTTHYGYSDMTGTVSRSTTTRIGTWNVVHNTKQFDSQWGTISWTDNLPPSTLAKVRVRSSNDRRSWSLWEEVNNFDALRKTPPGRYLNVEVTLQTFKDTAVPILYDLTVGAGSICGDLQHPYPTGDINHDCTVNLLDLALLAENWLKKS
jgi:streptogramin lyase